MKVLVLPRYSRYWEGSGVYLGVTHLVRGWMKLGFDVTTLAPRQGAARPPAGQNYVFGEFTYDPDWFRDDQMGGARILETDMTPTNDYETYVITQDVVDLLQRERFDAVLSVRPGANRLIRMATDAPIVTWCNFIPNFETARLGAFAHMQFGRVGIAAAQAGTLVSDRNIFESQYNAAATRQSLGVWLSPAALANWDRGVSIVNWGVPVPAVLEAATARQEHELPTVGFGGRLAGQKRWRETLEVMASLYRAGKVSRVLLTTQVDVNEKDTAELMAQYPFLDLLARANRDTWLKRLAEIDVFICLSRSESYGSGFVEAAVSGTVIVFAKAPWHLGTVHPEYPFVAQSDADVAVMAAWVCDNLERAREMAKPHREWLIREHDEVETPGRFARVVEDAVREDLVATFRG